MQPGCEKMGKLKGLKCDWRTSSKVIREETDLQYFLCQQSSKESGRAGSSEVDGWIRSSMSHQQTGGPNQKM